MSVIKNEEQAIMEALAEPFEPCDIEWRVMRSGVGANNIPWVIATPYITARAVQNRLDEVLGVFGWSNKHRMTQDGKGYVCTITAESNGKQVIKEDGAELVTKGNIDAVKTAMSNAFKRTAVLFGIGRYLYGIEEMFAKVSLVSSRREAIHNFIQVKPKNGNQKISAQWETPQLPNWALPSIKKSQELLKAVEQSETLEQLMISFSNAKNFSNAFSKKEWLKNEVVPVKDLVKEKIEEEVKREKEKLEAEIVSFVGELVSKIEKSPNESVFNQLSKEYHAKLQDFLLKNNVVGDEMINAISYFKERVENVKNTNN